MKEYVVTYGDKIFLVSAKDSKSAIKQVYEKYEEKFYKSDLKIKARSVGSLHYGNGNIVTLK